MAAINLDTAARLDITCRKGDTFSLELDFGQTIPGKAWTMHVRETDTSEGEENIIIEADQPDQITITDFNGVTDSLLTVTISAAIMEILNLECMFTTCRI